jgi:CheY-like chemotaxis protein
LRRRDRALTTGDIARPCHVTTNAVKKWIRTKNLPASRTPGGHFRILVRDFESFLDGRRRHDERGVDGYRRMRVLLVHHNPKARETVAGALSEPQLGLSIATASDGYEALIAIGRLQPELLILDLTTPRVDGFELCRLLKSHPGTRNMAIVLLAERNGPRGLETSSACPVEAVLRHPVRLPELLGTIEGIVAARPEVSFRRPPP